MTGKKGGLHQSAANWIGKTTTEVMQVEAKYIRTNISLWPAIHIAICSHIKMM